MDFWAYAAPPGFEEASRSRDQVEPLGVMTPEMLVIKNEWNPGGSMDLKNVRRAVALIVVLEDKAVPDFRRKRAIRLCPALTTAVHVAVGATCVHDEDRFRSKFHRVEHFGLGG